jgi:hypothetical protein
MKRPVYIFLFSVFLVSTLPIITFAQESPFTFSVSGGWVYMSLDQVDEDNQRDIEGWRVQGIPIEDFGSLKTALQFGAKGTYRFERDIVLSLSFTHAEREVRAEYLSYDATLELDRSVGFTDVLAGLGFYYPITPLHAEAYAGGEVGMMYARADAKAYGTQQKTSDTTQIDIVLDSEGHYKKNKLVLNAVAGMNFHVFEPLFLQVEAKYKFGKVGKLEGDVRRFNDTAVQETTIEFDYSGLFLSLGIGIVF